MRLHYAGQVELGGRTYLRFVGLGSGAMRRDRVDYVQRAWRRRLNLCVIVIAVFVYFHRV